MIERGKGGVTLPGRPSEQFDCRGCCFRGDERRQRSLGYGAVYQRASDERRLLRNRLQPQRDLRDHAERAERAGEELTEVVAGDVLDNPAATFERLTAAIDGADTDYVVAERTFAIAARAVPVRGDDAADCRAVGLRHVDRQALALLCQEIGQGLHRDA